MEGNASSPSTTRYRPSTLQAARFLLIDSHGPNPPGRGGANIHHDMHAGGPNPPGHGVEGRSRCTFGKAFAAFALALGSDDTHEVMELMSEGHKYLLNWRLDESVYDLVTTRWPIWRVLDLLQQKLHR